jgi:tRNA-(ms[2]io[6]A)-hydroxylase
MQARHSQRSTHAKGSVATVVWVSLPPMLHLAKPTRSDWAAYAIEHVAEILLDHAHCEKKAASTAVGMIFRYEERTELMEPLSQLAREELAHFEEVLERLSERGIPFRRLPAGEYASGLHQAVRKQEPHRLLDNLLTCALIEARSCERMQLFGEALMDRDPALGKLYSGLLAAEARHFRRYVELAELYFDKAEVLARLETLAIHESEVIARAKVEPRLHCG